MPQRLTVTVPGRIGAARAIGGAGQAQPSANGAASGPQEALNGPAAEMQQRLAAEAASLQQARQALLNAAASLQQLKQEVIAQSEQQLVELALQIAQKALMQEIEQGRYSIEPIVTEALRGVSTRHGVVVRLHPDDWAKCRAAQQDGEGGDEGGVRFVADASIARAACLVEMAEGIVESSVESNLADIADALDAPE